MELNPNHAVLNEVREHWNKIAGLLVAQLGGRAVITPRDIEEMDGKAITIRANDDEGIVLEVISMAEGELLARKEGGLPF